MKKETILKTLSRRSFIRNSVFAATGAAVLPSVLSGCNDDDDDKFTPEGDYGFLQAVASFDPAEDKVILWSRYTPATNETGAPTIVLDVAKDESFSQIVASEKVEIDTESDYTIHVDVSQLTSNTIYYYRFRNDRTAAVSVTGKTKTMPKSGEANQIKMAVVSCANFQAGLFNVYGAVAESDADVVIHLGDYIYEYGAGGYGSSELTTTLKRQHEPAGEILKLEDYRARYRQYRSDEQLQKAHQVKPFICVWDDHEIANDAYKDGAENHQANEGDFATRKAYALQVWHEYLGARVSDNSKIYRNFEIAGLVNLVMLDTRVIGRDKQLSYTDYITETGSLNAPAFAADWQNPSRTILGTEQLNWLKGKVTGSSAAWQVLGSQVLMSKIYIPAELLLITAQIAARNATPELFALYNAVATQLATIKVRMLQSDPTLTDAEKARVQTVLPYNLDSWDGYPSDREKVFAAATGKKLISLAGDTHNAWYTTLADVSGKKVGAEFATSSVSSPGFEAIFGDDAETIAGFEQANTLLVDNLKYVDASRRGYVMATFTSTQAIADYRYIQTLASKNATTTSGKTVTES